MAILDLTAATRLCYGGAEAVALWQGSTRLWQKPAGDIAFPAALFDVYGPCWDPYHPGVLQSPGGAAAGLGDTVGVVPWLGNAEEEDGVVGDPALTQGTAGFRPALAEVAGRRGFRFDGVATRLEAAWSARFEPPRAFTAFAMVHLDNGADLNPLCFARANTSNSFFEPFRVDGALHVYDTGLRHSASAFFDGDTLGVGYGTHLGWQCLLFEYELAAFATDGGRVRLSRDDTLLFDATVTPTRPATPEVTSFTTATLGARRWGSTVTGFFNRSVGRCGSIARRLDAGEKATLRQWLKGTAWVDP